MQRLYSMFPQGGPGVGLLLLRIAAAGVFALNLSHQFNFLIVSLIGLISLALLLGFLTTILTIIACVAAIANLLAAEPINVVYILSLLMSAALFFLGPGAYSVDARLFGLRVTVVPPRK